jgi:hypothetical protein
MSCGNILQGCAVHLKCCSLQLGMGMDWPAENTADSFDSDFGASFSTFNTYLRIPTRSDAARTAQWAVRNASVMWLVQHSGRSGMLVSSVVS